MEGHPVLEVMCHKIVKLGVENSNNEVDLLLVKGDFGLIKSCSEVQLTVID